MTNHELAHSHYLPEFMTRFDGNQPEIEAAEQLQVTHDFSAFIDDAFHVHSASVERNDTHHGDMVDLLSFSLQAGEQPWKVSLLKTAQESERSNNFDFPEKALTLQRLDAEGNDTEEYQYQLRDEVVRRRDLDFGLDADEIMDDDTARKNKLFDQPISHQELDGLMALVDGGELTPIASA